MARHTILAAIGGVMAGALAVTGLVSVATPSDPCESAYTKPMNSTEKLKRYEDCRFDRIDKALSDTPSAPASPSETPTATPEPTVTPSETPSASATPSDTPSPSVSQTPTQTPTPSPTVTHVGDWPGASNTGVPAGTVLTAYTGAMTITTAGTVIDSKTINGCLDIKANNVTVKRSRLTGACFFNVLNDSGNTGLQLVDIEIDGGNTNAAGAGIGGRNYTCLRCDIHRTGDGLKLGDNVTIQDSWIHDLYGANDSHNDGMQASDGNNIRVLHNTITPVYKGSTSAIIIKADFGPISDLVFDSNYVGGGAYTVYAGVGYGNGIPNATGVRITNNQFTTVYFPKGGAFGPITNTGAGVTVAGNVWADGPNAGRTVA